MLYELVRNYNTFVRMVNFLIEILIHFTRAIQLVICDSYGYQILFHFQVEVLASLARPKKVTLLGSDGKLYPMMCKPKDDLRKDARLMEFNSIVNKCLRKDPESRRRDLHIRTYVSLSTIRQLRGGGVTFRSSSVSCLSAQDLCVDFAFDLDLNYFIIYFQTVIPLNEECGLLEWVNNTNGLRPILINMYKERNLATSGKELMSMKLANNAPME